MKRMFITIAIVLASVTFAKADDRPVTFEQLPKAAQTFINTNFPKDKVSFATVDDDIIAPDYEVALVSGVMMQFRHDGSLCHCKSRLPAGGGSRCSLHHGSCRRDRPRQTNGTGRQFHLQKLHH